MVATSRSKVLTVCLMTALASSAGVAAALSAGPVDAKAEPGQLAQLVADLGSDDVIKRETASELLLADESVSLGDLEELLTRPDLNPEQRCRLSQIARRRFMESPRPALGIQFDVVLSDRAAILKVWENFPASEKLQPGDIIISCNGEELRSRTASARLGAHIFSREPGDSISLVVRRGAEKLAFDVKLGTYSDMEGRQPPIDRLQSAWDMRCARYAPAARPAIEPNAQVTDWRTDASPMETQKIIRARNHLPPIYRMVRVVAGGEPRGGVLDYEEIAALQNNPRDPRFARLWDQQRRVQAMPPMWGNVSGPAQTVQQELSLLESRKIQIERDIDNFRLPGVMKPEQLAQNEMFLRSRREELTRINRLIDAIRAEIAEEQGAEAGPRTEPGGGR